jgi:hypothetical protein
MAGSESRSLEVEFSVGVQAGYLYCLRCCSDFVFLWAAVCCCREGKEQTEGTWKARLVLTSGRAWLLLIFKSEIERRPMQLFALS